MAEQGAAPTAAAAAAEPGDAAAARAEQDGEQPLQQQPQQPQGPLSYAASLEDVQQAAKRIAGHVHRTPVLTCSTLDRLSGRSLHFKCEVFQRTYVRMPLSPARTKQALRGAASPNPFSNRPLVCSPSHSYYVLMLHAWGVHTQGRPHGGMERPQCGSCMHARLTRPCG